MQEAADVMEDALKSVKIEMPCVEVISNVTAKPVKYMIINLFRFHLLNKTLRVVCKCRRDSKKISGTSGCNCPMGT
jgi:hypothetical protein